MWFEESGGIELVKKFAWRIGDNEVTSCCYSMLHQRYTARATIALFPNVAELGPAITPVKHACYSFCSTV